MIVEFPSGAELPVYAGDGTPLNVQVYGCDHGAPVVLVHGYLADSRVWHAQVADLARDFRVITYDQRGHGRSGAAHWRSYGQDTLAADLELVMSESIRPDERALIVGHSLGGRTLMAWAERHPSSFARRVAGVGLVNTSPADPAKFLKYRRARLALVHLAGGVQIGPRAARYVRPKMISMTTAPGTPSDVGDLIFEMFTTIQPSARRGWARKLMTELRPVDPCALMAPVMVLDGRWDRLLVGENHSGEICCTAKKLFRYATLDSGHYSILERPADVNTHLRDLADAVL